jgi:hypothetical protein
VFVEGMILVQVAETGVEAETLARLPDRQIREAALDDVPLLDAREDVALKIILPYADNRSLSRREARYNATKERALKTSSVSFLTNLAFARCSQGSGRQASSAPRPSELVSLLPVVPRKVNCAVRSKRGGGSGGAWGLR